MMPVTSLSLLIWPGRPAQVEARRQVERHARQVEEGMTD